MTDQACADSMAIFSSVLRLGHFVASHEILHALEAVRRGPAFTIDVAPPSFVLIDECSQTTPQTLGKMLELLGDREARCQAHHQSHGNRRKI